MVFIKAKFIWMDGSFVTWENAKIHVLSHVIHYASGVFEGIRCYETTDGPAIFRLEDHVTRLFNSAKIYRLEIPYTEQAFKDAIISVVKKNELKSCYIRPIIFRGYSELGVNPLNCPVNCAIGAWPWGHYLGDAIKKGAKVMVSSWIRPPQMVLPSKAKAVGNYLNSVLMKMEAIEKGFDEAIALNSNGYVSEGTGENLFMVCNGSIITPPSNADILLGITRESVIKIAKDLGYPVIERNISRGELYCADELFFTGTAAEVTPIIKLDKIDIGSGKPGPITKEIQEIFFSVVKGKNPKYRKWLTYVYQNKK
jgi:branched-chain amino acid aminotransferase